MKHTLESSKLFPIIAWTVVIAFAFVTYGLAIHLRAELSDLEKGVDRLEKKLDDMDTKKNAAAQ